MLTDGCRAETRLPPYDSMPDPINDIGPDKSLRSFGAERVRGSWLTLRDTWVRALHAQTFI